ncbi:MAG: TatD family hydrolase [Bdellovibrio sp.]|nr:TatD family hydrolase [Bdellovibrio sp.]
MLPIINMLIDTHCHLDSDFSPKTIPDLLREATLADVSIMIAVATELDSVKKVSEISSQYENVFCTVGIHPHEAKKFDISDVLILKEAAMNPKCKAIGEIGLDYHYKFSTPEEQKYTLEQQLNLAAKLGLPVVIHSREAEEDLEISLSRYAKRVKTGAIPGVLHCFTGTKEFGLKCLDLGFYVSFSGILTFKNADSIRECARVFPLDRIVIETDAPFLAPVPWRGKKCEPSYLKLTAQKLAEIRGMSFDEVAQATTENAKRLFNI